ncbi:TPA: hypothetical protein ACL8I3_002089, partial [Streptococcus pneumoniae]
VSSQKRSRDLLPSEGKIKKPRDFLDSLHIICGSIIFVVGNPPMDIMEPILCRKKVPYDL